ncbi:MAG: class I adenylate-forming enzyme family protein [Ilumatobacteraceae bacterium]
MKRSRDHQAVPLADRLPAHRRSVRIELDRPMELAPVLGDRLDYGRFADLIVDTSGRLAAEGVGAGSTVAIVKQNGLDICALGLAAQRIGAVPALLSGTLAPADVAALLTALRPALLVTDRATTRDGALAGIDLDGLVSRTWIVDDHSRGLASWTGEPPAPFMARSPDLPSLITHTSGTTGIPKLVVQSTASLRATVRVNTKAARLLRLRGGVAARLSYVHVRSMAGITAMLELTAPLLALTTQHPPTAVAALRAFKPFLVEANPADYVDWEPVIASSDAPLAGVQYFINNFDAAHPRTVKALLRASDRRHPVYVQVYGQSESGPVTMRADTRSTAEHSDGRCVGFPVPGHSHVRIAASGTIEVRSKGLALDYLGRHDEFAAKFDGRWWDMGDVGARTRWGCLHLLDRAVDAADDVPSLLAIEDQLLERIPTLQEVVLVNGVCHLPTPLVCTYDGSPLAAETWARVVEDLPALAEPVYCRTDQLPRTATGKVQRYRLAEQLRSGASEGRRT